MDLQPCQFHPAHYLHCNRELSRLIICGLIGGTFLGPIRSALKHYQITVHTTEDRSRSIFMVVSQS